MDFLPLKHLEYEMMYFVDGVTKNTSGDFYSYAEFERFIKGITNSLTEEEQERITQDKETMLKERAEEERRKKLEGLSEPSKPVKEPPKIEVYHVGGREIRVVGESVLIFDQSMNGNRLISYQDYTAEQVRRIVNDNQTELYKIWTEPEKRQHFVNELKKVGVTFEHLKEITHLYNVDAFDLLLHFAFRRSEEHTSELQSH